MNNIKLFQTERTWNDIKEEVIALADTEFNQGMAQGGKLTRSLEALLCSVFDRRYCITTASCTDALYLSIEALHLPPNSFIGVANFTFTATAHAIFRAGHIAIPVDVKPNGCINVDKIPKSVSAVVAVDLFGNMSDWKALSQLSIPVINDCAQAIESKSTNGYSASRGVTSCLSFSPSKTISAFGSGGAILTDDKGIAEYCQLLKLHGKRKNSDVSVHPGLNSAMSSFEVAAVMVGFEHHFKWISRREQIASYLISKAKFETLNDRTLLQHTNHKLVFTVPNRDAVMQTLSNHGVDSAAHYSITINDEWLYNQPNEYPISDYLKESVITIPNQHTLTDTEVEHIGDVLCNEF